MKPKATPSPAFRRAVDRHEAALLAARVAESLAVYADRANDPAAAALARATTAHADRTKTQLHSAIVQEAVRFSRMPSVPGESPRAYGAHLRRLMDEATARAVENARRLLHEYARQWTADREHSARVAAEWRASQQRLDDDAARAAALESPAAAQ